MILLKDDFKLLPLRQWQEICSHCKHFYDIHTWHNSIKYSRYVYNRGGSLNSLSFFFFFWPQVNRTKGWTSWRRCGSRSSRSQASIRKPAAKSPTRSCALAKAWAALQSNKPTELITIIPRARQGPKCQASEGSCCWSSMFTHFVLSAWSVCCRLLDRWTRPGVFYHDNPLPGKGRW